MLARLSILIVTLFFISADQQETNWFNLLGKTFAEKEVTAVFSKYGEKSGHNDATNSAVQINWQDAGISLKLNGESEISDIYFINSNYSIANTKFSQFPDPLPLDVRFNMSPKELKETLGKPTKDEGNTFRRVFYKTNYEYEFLFRRSKMRYMRIGLID